MTDLASFSGRTALPCPWRVEKLRCFTHLTASIAGFTSRHNQQSSRRYVQRATAQVAEDAQIMPGGKESGMRTVGDVMTSKTVFSARPDTTIDEALEILVSNRITGLPVLDDAEKVVGVVSDFDLLSLDHISGERQTNGIFPDVATDWSAFQEIQKLISKNHGRVIADVMTADPITVRKETRLEAAARILLDKRIRRLPVVDAEGKLVGMFSRGDVIKAAVRTRDLIRSVSGSQEDL